MNKKQRFRIYFTTNGEPMYTYMNSYAYDYIMNNCFKFDIILDRFTNYKVSIFFL